MKSQGLLKHVALVQQKLVLYQMGWLQSGYKVEKNIWVNWCFDDNSLAD